MSDGETSQVTVIGKPQPKTWDNYEQGCLSTFGGGHRSDGHLDAFHHGMSTVFNLLRGEFPSAEVCKSAPALLGACEAMVANIDSWMATGIPADVQESEILYSQMVRAIAKAKGES